MTHTLPDLPYGFDALEPHIDARTMEIHHGKHHAGYVAKLNAAIEQAQGLEGKDVDVLISDIQALP
ncbi:MAG: superoxide dismutase, partial [Gemmatimonadetes bacterium]|nr:superoxide dismutase [Gemmatimonadota bacterium]